MNSITGLLSELKRVYINPVTELHHKDPFQLLIATILSAQCTDVQVNRVTKGLFGRYRTPGDFADADITELEDIIRPTGFFKNKARMIMDCSRQLVKEFSGIVPSTMEGLTSLKGVGRKTASVVLASGFNIPAIAVDTHVLRITNRLGLADSKDPVKVEMRLREILPEGDWIFYSMAIILHGRRVCKARNPLCNICTIREFCNWEG